MKYTRTFKELNKNDAPIAGGKGASLGEMLQSGIPVPDGFVVLASTFDGFLKETDLVQEVESILATVKHDVIHTVESASEQIRTLIESKEIPEDIQIEILNQFENLDAQFVAVRSSATAEDGVDHAWAGQLESYLNTTEETLFAHVKHCWASLFTPRAIFYRFEKKLHTTDISVAVVVQKMIQSEVSGIAFSVHPITEDPNQLIIEAGFGLGEAIVSGSVTPDSYVVEKSPRKIIDINVSTQTKGLFGLPNGGNEWRSIEEAQASSQVLNAEQILELAELVIKIENHYGFPCDIEWAFEGGKFYIVQSRPITTLSSSIESKKLFKKDDYILTFWVKGVSVFVTDIHLDAYKKLEVLYVIDKGLFKQYFTKKAYEQALDQGLEFYSDENRFDTYKKELSLHCEIFKQFFESEITNHQNLSIDKVVTFFDYTQKLCGDYSQMNFESTDKAFTHQEQNPIIKRNLTEVAKFKDVVRAVMNTVLFEPDGYLSKFFAILAKQFDINASILDNLTRQEILELFEGKRPNESIVSKRQEAFVESYNIEGFLSGKEAEAIIQEFKENVCHSDVIKGQVASKGKVTGKVKIITVDYSNLALVNSEMDKMEQGEILVAETTAPELMIACKKAGAIVTDTGGLMSHAAIVSREFGIPCIIGTKFATQLLKDGDTVEVDADNGIVRILETKAQKDSSGELDFSKYTMVPQGKRRTSILDALLKIKGRSLHLEKEIGLGYKAIVINSLGEQFVDKESTEKIKDFLNTKSFDDIQKYIEKMTTLDSELEKKVLADSSLNQNEDFERLYAYFFIARYLSEFLFATLSPEQQHYIEEWRNNPHVFSSLVLYEQNHPDSGEEGEWSWVILEGEVCFVHKNIRFAKENKEQGDNKEIKGMAGYPGVVQGKVRVVLSAEDINLVEEGEIIVAPMTTVDFGTAMKKAAAFVTDEGGVTSHAAIIAREMKKPCILRTKIGTQVLKTGDMVEVDADSGIVKILPKHLHLDPNDYVRMFAGRSLSYVFTNIFLGYYNKFGVLSIQGSDSWICFLPKVAEEITLKEGSELYASKDLYFTYYAEFQEYITSSTKYFELVLLKEQLVPSEVEEFFQLASKHFSFYSKTEFFYTDKIDQSKMVISVQEFDKLKLDGRSYLNKILFEEKGFVRSLTKKIAEQFGITESDLLNYTIKEIVELVETGKKIEDEKIKDREIFFVSKDIVLAGSNALPLVNKFFSAYRELSDTIRGTVAYKGKVTGKARVLVVDFRNIESVSVAVEAMEKGEILVAETTAPEIIQACYKAAAIVTNQGGMLSHAAIISRELKIPCIVGTDKEVILNIKTGDLLEIDADNGVIRILSKTN